MPGRIVPQFQDQSGRTGGTGLGGVGLGGVGLGGTGLLGRPGLPGIGGTGLPGIGGTGLSGIGGTGLSGRPGLSGSGATGLSGIGRLALPAWDWQPCPACQNHSPGLTSRFHLPEEEEWGWFPGSLATHRGCKAQNHIRNMQRLK